MHRVSLLQKTLTNNSSKTTCFNRQLAHSLRRNAAILRSSTRTPFCTLKKTSLKPALLTTALNKHTPAPALFSAITFGGHIVDKKKAVRLGSTQSPATPSEIEITENNRRSKYLLVRICQRIIRFLDDWILEPVLTIRRLTHILLLFIPVAITVPVVFFGRKVDKEENSAGTLWWFDFLANQMERAGPTFIKVILIIVLLKR
jgi:hypothetical protein